MEFKEINDFYDEICFKSINGLKLTETESSFFNAYTMLFMWAKVLSDEKEKELREVYKKYGIDFKKF